MGKLIQWFKKLTHVKPYPEAHLIRDKSTPFGTPGKLYWNGQFLCYTLEDPWRNNEKRVSCVPTGTYPCVPHGHEPDTTVKFKRVWHVTKVPARDAILIHAGNTEDDTLGCILVGMARGELNGQLAILQSMDALTMLRDKLPKFFNLKIS